MFLNSDKYAFFIFSISTDIHSTERHCNWNWIKVSILTSMNHSQK